MLHALPLPRLQKAIDHIAAACLAEGITEAVICPGSRNAPLTIAFVRSGKFTCLSVADERSAGFIALGKAIALQKPVVLICTSGSAVANFYPAVLEAYYQHVPLVVITADRPSEMIDQWDGQTIRQSGLFGSHVLGFWPTPESYSNPPLFAQITQNAIRKATSSLPGPVHINVPLFEPLYPDPERGYSAEWEISERIKYPIKTDPFESTILKGKKILVLRGMRQDKVLVAPQGVAVYEDILCRNTADADTVSELIFMNKDDAYLEALKPDILLTDGTAILSKTVKQFLRAWPPTLHFHFSLYGEIADPFDTRPELVRNDLEGIFQDLAEHGDSAYAELLVNESRRCRASRDLVLKASSWNEFKVIHTALDHLPDSAVIHAANSMAIRYVAYCEPQKRGHAVYSNRGTSGIDGCVSTALGFASIHKGNNHLFVGDVAFFYDSNAFWNALAQTPLKVVLINNGGGGIFRLIDGPASQPESHEFFESSHERDAKDLCKNLGIAYLRAENEAELEKALVELNKSGKPCVLEVFTEPKADQLFFNHYKSVFHGV